MKITDYALIFIGVTLPIILIAYVNIALAIRTYQQEMYYQRVIDSAVEDTISEMKRIESYEITNDYGYSGSVDNKISINPELAVSTFFNSFYSSLNIYGDDATQSLVQLYVPVLAIIDYNGVYISSVENINGELKHTLKPKRYFSFEYAGDDSGYVYVLKNGAWRKLDYNGANYELTSTTINSSNLRYYHNVEFTTDDRVFHTFSNPSYNSSQEFYIRDSSNNSPLFNRLIVVNKPAFLDFLESQRQEIMIDIVTEELTYAANKNNQFAHQKGISYNFAFTVQSNDEMYNYIQNVGVLALVQGIRVGNRYLNYKAYNMSDLVLTHKYYLTTGSTNFANNLYHKTDRCLEYSKDSNNVSPNIVYTREDAASLGYYPCPICNP